MQIHTGKIYENKNVDMQNLLQYSKEPNVKLKKPAFFDAPAVEVSFSREGMSALREAQNESDYEGYIECKKQAISEEARYWIDNEIELEHYFSMRKMSAETLKDKNYDVKDLMESMIETYETTYNQILELHKDGNRLFVSEKTGTRSITLEEDLKALDNAFGWRLSNLEGYITCQQTNKQFENPGDISWFFKRNSSYITKENRPDTYNYLDKDYIETAVSMMESAKEKFLKMCEATNCKEGIGKSIIWNMMNSNILFMEKTQRLFG